VTGTTLQLVLTVLLVGFLLVRNLPGALLFLRPAWIRVRREGGADAVSPDGHGVAIAEMLDAVEELGFVPLGVLRESRPLGRTRREFVFAHEAEHAFAGVMPVGDEAWLFFLSPYEAGQAVITSDFRWPAVERADYLAGGLPAATPVEVWNAHRRRAARMVESGARPLSGLTLERREDVARAFYRTGPGRRETRRREARPFMFSVFAVALLASAVKAFLEGR
jgi:hypothetical protein